MRRRVHPLCARTHPHPLAHGCFADVSYVLAGLRWRGKTRVVCVCIFCVCDDDGWSDRAAEGASLTARASYDGARWRDLRCVYASPCFCGKEYAFLLVLSVDPAMAVCVCTLPPLGALTTMRASCLGVHALIGVCIHAWRPWGNLV
jgi:hypothetical protein